MENVIRVPRVKGPKGICFKTGVDGTVELFYHCMLPKGHKERCQWDTDAYRQKVKEQKGSRT